MRNCWTSAVTRFISMDGWLLVRFTKRSIAKPRLRWLGTTLLYIGITFMNWGFMLRTGRWLHVYHAQKPSGPYHSYEPLKGRLISSPPFHFQGKEVERDSLE